MPVLIRPGLRPPAFTLSRFPKRAQLGQPIPVHPDPSMGCCPRPLWRWRSQSWRLSIVSRQDAKTPRRQDAKNATSAPSWKSRTWRASRSCLTDIVALDVECLDCRSGMAASARELRIGNPTVSAARPKPRTGPDGRHSLPGIPSGQIKLTLTAGVRFFAQVDLVAVMPGQPTEADFALVLKNKL